MAIFLAVLAAWAAVPLAAAQKKDEILLSFSGALKMIDKKEIDLEVEPGNVMSFVRTKRTRFQAGKKAVDPEGLRPGDALTIQALQKLNGELEAVIVTLNARATP